MKCVFNGTISSSAMLQFASSLEAQLEDIYKTTGRTLQRIRREKGLSQQQVANKCRRLDRVKISKIESGLTRCAYDYLVEIAMALEIDLWFISIDPKSTDPSEKK